MDGLPLQPLVGRGGGRAAVPGAASDEGEADDGDEAAEEGGKDDDDVGVDGQGARRLRVVGGLEEPRWRTHCLDSHN